MFDRLELLIGKEKFNILAKLNVLIVGIGGVGSYAFEALVRSNIGKITIVDHDVIDLSNLNRQLITNQNNIGHDKVKEAKSRAISINPNIIIQDLKIFLDNSNINDLFNNNYFDYVIDACDTIATKLLLIDKCQQLNIKIISCMGMAKKLDPSKIKICDISKTSYDPIAKTIRSKMRNKKLLVVSSTEEIIESNSKVLGSNSFVPATAGLLCASYVINDIILMKEEI